MRKASYIMVVLSVCFFLFVSLTPNLVKANGSPLRAIKATSCFNQDTGVLTGYSNDCVQGEGNCEDNGCANGSEGPFTLPDPE